MDIVEELWIAAGGGAGDLAPVTLGGAELVLPSVYDVTGFATAAVAGATLAAARVHAMRNEIAARRVRVDRRAASAAFISEVLFTPDGWERPPVWDPIAGDYRAADGWLRLHTNYRYHRAAAAKVLGGVGRDGDVGGGDRGRGGGDRAAVAEEVRRWTATELEGAIVDAGGCAAALHDRAAWIASPAGAACATEPVSRIQTRPADVPRALTVADPRPYGGLRVLDLTRVIAGPVATRFLAAYGADVLRVDPRGFEEVPAILPESTVGKRRTALDLTDATDRAAFERLLAVADVLVTGFRPGALARLRYDNATIRAANPAIIMATLCAYGWDGPWQARRGFDSLVQMSCGIAAAGAAAAGVDKPVPLPAQALDHATGYLLAAAVGVALERLATSGRTSDIRMSLVGTANALMARPVADGLTGPRPTWVPTDTQPTTTEWGPARRVPVPGRIDGVPAHWTIDAGRLGADAPTWASPPTGTVS
jgi:CoA-transferase family III